MVLVAAAWRRQAWLAWRRQALGYLYGGVDQLADLKQMLDFALDRELIIVIPLGGKWTAHDLRRTTGTMMARLGFSTR